MQDACSIRQAPGRSVLPLSLWADLDASVVSEARAGLGPCHARVLSPVQCALGAGGHYQAHEWRSPGCQPCLMIVNTEQAKIKSGH